MYCQTAMQKTMYTPTKPETAEVTYAFAGWSPEIVSVTDEATYTATFTTITKTYTITQAQTNTHIPLRRQHKPSVFLR